MTMMMTMNTTLKWMISLKMKANPKKKYQSIFGRYLDMTGKGTKNVNFKLLQSKQQNNKDDYSSMNKNFGNKCSYQKMFCFVFFFALQKFNER